MAKPLVTAAESIQNSHRETVDLTCKVLDKEQATQKSTNECRNITKTMNDPKVYRPFS